MELLLTGVLAILTGLSWWQSFFQNNVTLFKKRMELYQDYARKYHFFVDYAEECNKHIISLQSQEFHAENIEKKKKLLQKFSDFEGASSPMMFVGFSNKINSILTQNIEGAKLITDFLTQTDLRKSGISQDQVDSALDTLEKVRNIDSDLNHLFRTELPLRNFKFYRKKFFAKICPCFKNNGGLC